jgi:hypothetical protein
LAPPTALIAASVETAHQLQERGSSVDKKAFNPFEMAQAQFDKVADIINLDAPTRELLRIPLREYSFAIPVRMDDGSVKVFRGFRVQHNDARVAL